MSSQRNTKPQKMKQPPQSQPQIPSPQPQQSQSQQPQQLQPQQLQSQKNDTQNDQSSSSSSASGNYTETHRNILQHFLKKGCMSQTELQKLKDKLVAENNTLYGEVPQDKTINDFINTINHRIDFLSLRIMNIKLPQHPDEYYFGLINEDVDELSKHATQYSTMQLTQFNEIIGLLIQNQRSHTQTLEFDVLEKIQMKDIEEKRLLLEKLIDDHWLERCTIEGTTSIWLGARTVADLKLYMEKNFN